MRAAFIEREGTMASVSPFRVQLSTEQRQELERRARAYTEPYCRVVRAKMVLLAADGLANVDIADRLDTSPKSCTAGGSDLYNEASRVSTTIRGPAARQPSAPRLPPRPSSSPASCPPKPGCRCRAGAAPSWPWN